MLDDDLGRDMTALDAREQQEALVDELSDHPSHEENETDIVNEDTQETGETEVEAAAPAEETAEPAIEWSQEELAAHARMAEALLFAAAEPLDEKTIADRLPEGADINAIVERLTADYEHRGVNLRKIDKSWRFTTAPDIAYILEKEKVTPRKLSRAAMETLAIIAYHQPCTRADIEDVRGVQVAKGSLDQLLEIGWVRLAGKRKDVPGRPTLYRTTQSFLEHFTLESVQDLPGLSDLKAAGLLDARLPPGFSVPNPADGDDDESVDDDDDTEFSQNFLEEDPDDEAADA